MSVDLNRSLPTRARAQHIVDAIRKGHNTPTIAKSLDRKDHPGVRRTIERIREDLDNYDTDVDEVAVQRAYEGDRAAWLALTHYERRACLDRLMERGLAGKGHVRWPELDAVVPGWAELGWLDYWCEATGEDQVRFRAMLNSRKNAA